MSIWILAFLVIGLTTLAGWRQGGIRAAVAFGGILFATLLCGLVGKLFHLLLPLVGMKDPLLVWALSPILGFIVITLIFSAIAFNVHRKVDVHYRHKASELRLALWQRLNSRLGICLGVLNGAIYFVLIIFLIFNLSYLTMQASANVPQPSMLLRVANSLGQGLQTTGLARTAAAVGTLNENYYKDADLTGFLMQNPQAASRLVEYPAFTSLWQRDDMMELVQDGQLTNALVSGASVGEVLKLQSVQDFLQNKEQAQRVSLLFQTNMDDLMEYLKTGKSAKYDGEKILGRWEFNVPVTMAWMRQTQPKMAASEMRAVRSLWTAAYAQTRVLVTADHQLFISNLPKFQSAPPGQPQFQPEAWKGEWSKDDANYTLDIKLGDQEKFLTATTDGLRLSVKDGKSLLILDKVD